MKASKKLKNELVHDVRATLKDGPQSYTAVTDEFGKLLAWGLKDASEWIWVHKNFRK